MEPRNIAGLCRVTNVDGDYVRELLAEKMVRDLDERMTGDLVVRGLGDPGRSQAARFRA